jgi:hypothetical protein
VSERKRGLAGDEQLSDVENVGAALSQASTRAVILSLLVRVGENSVLTTSKGVVAPATLADVSVIFVEFGDAEHGADSPMAQRQIEIS